MSPNRRSDTDQETSQLIESWKLPVGGVQPERPQVPTSTPPAPIPHPWKPKLTELTPRAMQAAAIYGMGFKLSVGIIQFKCRSLIRSL